MKTILLCAALSFVVWTAPACADEICVGPACVGNGEHRDRTVTKVGRSVNTATLTKVGRSVNTATPTKVGNTANTVTLTKVGRNADPAIEETRRSTRFKVPLDTISRLERLRADITCGR